LRQSSRRLLEDKGNWLQLHGEQVPPVPGQKTLIGMVVVEDGAALEAGLDGFEDVGRETLQDQLETGRLKSPDTGRGLVRVRGQIIIGEIKELRRWLGVADKKRLF